MNREYNDNKMYNSALDELRFSDEAKSRMVNRLMAAAEQPELQGSLFPTFLPTAQMQWPSMPLPCFWSCATMWASILTV